MWIADHWKDYEVIDYLRWGKAGALGQVYPRPSRSAGHLEYTEEKRSWMEPA